jgi:sulfur carrier protein
MPKETGLLKVVVNDAEHRFPRRTTLALLVEQWTTVASGCAVAVNGAIVPRGSWRSHQIADGDRVEIVSAQPGG